MRPHTRTHCNKKAGECSGDGGGNNGGHAATAAASPGGGGGGEASRCTRTSMSAAASAAAINSAAAALQHHHHHHARCLRPTAAVAAVAESSGGGSSSSIITTAAGCSGGGTSVASTSSVTAAGDEGSSGVLCGSSGAGGSTMMRHYSLVELPAELLVKIIEYIPFKEHSHIRLVCRRLNEIAAGRLNSTFQQLQNKMLIRFQNIKAQMPRRESARRNHPLARECDIVETLHMRLTLLQMTFGKHIERKHICFFPGEILDEVYRILRYIQSTHPPLGRTYKVTDELFDLSTMAMEYFKENIEPSLPDVTYIGSEFLDFTPPFASPLKKISRTGGLDSPISSRASAVGSSCSEPPISYSQFGVDEYDEDKVGDGVGGGVVGGVAVGQTNMVLRKRIKRIRAGMKKYNTQLDEVKRELKSCKSKMDGQSKQVAEYTSRLDEYDKKLEENSRKFGSVLAELNKCKTELQFYRSRAHLHQCQNCGSSLTDQASDTPATSDQTDNTSDQQVGFPNIEGVDKQAMVEDWLNPDTPPYRAPSTGYKNCGGVGANNDESKPQVQQNNTNIQKNYKAEDDGYLKFAAPTQQHSAACSGGSGCYTRAGPRSPGSPRASHAAAAAAAAGSGATGGTAAASTAAAGGGLQASLSSCGGGAAAASVAAAGCSASACVGPPSPGPSGVRKRKSRDEEDNKKVCLRGHHLVKGTRTKRPKLAGPS